MKFLEGFRSDDNYCASFVHVNVHVDLDGGHGEQRTILQSWGPPLTLKGVPDTQPRPSTCTETLT